MIFMHKESGTIVELREWNSDAEELKLVYGDGLGIYLSGIGHSDYGLEFIGFL